MFFQPELRAFQNCPPRDRVPTQLIYLTATATSFRTTRRRRRHCPPGTRRRRHWYSASPFLIITALAAPTQNPPAVQLNQQTIATATRTPHTAKVRSPRSPINSKLPVFNPKYTGWASNRAACLTRALAHPPWPPPPAWRWPRRSDPPNVLPRPTQSPLACRKEKNKTPPPRKLQQLTRALSKAGIAQDLPECPSRRAHPSQGT